MKLSKAITKSEKWFDFCNSLIGNGELKSNDRNRIAASLFRVSIGHHGGIHILIVTEHYGSAFALLRPQFEGLVRGAWYLHCADDQQIDAFKNENEPPNIKKLITDIEGTPGCADLGNVLRETKEKVWKTLCDYTHGGLRQVLFSHTSTEITSSYDEEDIISVVNQSCRITLITVIALAGLFDDLILKDKLISRWDSIFEEDIRLASIAEKREKSFRKAEAVEHGEVW